MKTNANPSTYGNYDKTERKNQTKNKASGFEPGNINSSCPPKIKYNDSLQAPRSTHLVHTITSPGITPDSYRQADIRECRNEVEHP